MQFAARWSGLVRMKYQTIAGSRRHSQSSCYWWFETSAIFLLLCSSVAVPTRKSIRFAHCINILKSQWEEEEEKEERGRGKRWFYFMLMLAWNKKQSPEAEPFIRPDNWPGRARGARHRRREGVPPLLLFVTLLRGGNILFFREFYFSPPGQGEGGGGHHGEHL